MLKDFLLELENSVILERQKKEPDYIKAATQRHLYFNQLEQEYSSNPHLDELFSNYESAQEEVNNIILQWMYEQGFADGFRTADSTLKRPVE